MDDSRAVVLAVDIGGTRIKAALVDQAYHEVVRSTTPTPPGLGDDLGPVVGQLMADLLRQAGDHPPGWSAADWSRQGSSMINKVS